MQLQGVPPRAAQARAALNRLHQEVVYALEEGDGTTEMLTGMDLAEVLAIAVSIGKLIDEHLPVGDPRRARFEINLAFMSGYHVVPRTK